MFDINIVTPELKDACLTYEDLQRQFIHNKATGKDKEAEELIPLINKAEKRYNAEYDKWCDSINAPYMKFNKLKK